MVNDIITSYTGKFHYLFKAPELLLHQPPTYASDYYSLGLILREFIKDRVYIL